MASGDYHFLYPRFINLTCQIFFYPIFRIKRRKVEKLENSEEDILYGAEEKSLGKLNCLYQPLLFTFYSCSTPYFQCSPFVAATCIIQSILNYFLTS